MGDNYKAFVRARIAKVGLLGRALILVAPLGLTFLGGFRWDECRELYLLLLPLSCLYITLFIKFIIKTAHKYPRTGPKLSTEYVSLGNYLLLALITSEFLLIVLEAFFVIPGADYFFIAIVAIECAFGLYAGFYLSELFSNNKVAAVDSWGSDE